LALSALLVAILVGCSAWDRVLLYDTGLYHLQAVKWMARYPVVTGLANLHTRFGYNNSVHLFGAYADTLWEGVAAHITNGFLLAFVVIHWFAEIFGAHTPRGRLRQAYCLFTLPWLLAKIWLGEVSSLSTDLPLTIFSFVVILELLSMPRGTGRRIVLPGALLVAMAAVATTTKLGGAALLVVVSAVILTVARKQLLTRAWAIALALPGLLLVGWVSRGIALSGWIAYPAFGHLPLRWAVPTDVAAFDYGNIQSWARMWDTTPAAIAAHDFWWWFAPWLDRFRASRECLLLAVSTALLAWRAAQGPSRSAARSAGELGVIAACLLGIVEWFVGAPDLRYGNFWFWMLPATLVAPMIAGMLSDARLRTLLVAVSIALVAWSGGFALHAPATMPKLWGRPPAPQRMKTTLTTIRRPTKIYVPSEGSGEDRCFDEELPCSPQQGALMRDPSRLGAGYVPLPR
jgi:hypothetical protein